MAKSAQVYLKTLKNLKKLSLCKEQAQERYVLRQACIQAREKYELNVEIKNNKLVMKDSGLSYSAKDLLEHLKVKK